MKNTGEILEYYAYTLQSRFEWLSREFFSRCFHIQLPYGQKIDGRKIQDMYSGNRKLYDDHE